MHPFSIRKAKYNIRWSNELCALNKSSTLSANLDSLALEVVVIEEEADF